MNYVRPKKSLGQHFLNDKNIAQKIVNGLTFNKNILEIGPGKGVLTQYLVQRNCECLKIIEIDGESVDYLKENIKIEHKNILFADFITTNIKSIYNTEFAIIGNFPYNIGSQIFFKVLQNHEQVVEVVCMIQKEVAQRIATEPGSRVYGILSVLLQTFYNIEYLFTVNEKVFTPPPKVKSAVIKLTRNNRKSLNCDEQLFFSVVKTAFNQRRKTLSNSLKPILNGKKIDLPILLKRPEQLSVNDFEKITQIIQQIIK